MGFMPSRGDYMAFESGQMPFLREVDFFQQLIDTGELATLGSRYQRRAEELRAQEVIFDA